MSKCQDPAKVPTGLSCFDQITGGGIPKPAAMALIGSVDGGKELFARQLVWNLLRKGSKVLYYSVNQAADELRYDLLSYDWDVAPYEENGMLRIVDVFSQATERMSSEFKKNIDPNGKLSELSFHKTVYDLKTIYAEGMRFIPVLSKSPQHRVAIFDTISPLFSTNTEGVFQMIHALKFATRLSKATGIGIMHTGIHDSKTEETFKSLADAIIQINQIEAGTSSSLTISKYPGEYKTGPFPFQISGEGIKIIPVPMPDLSM
ncbi:MAG: RAD55 family ATPase [Promethearchaeota archaeon]